MLAKRWREHGDSKADKERIEDPSKLGARAKVVKEYLNLNGK